jgi:hypothetical protein
VELHQGQIRIRAAELGLEGDSSFIRAGVREPTFAGAESHDQELIVLAALELERSAMGAIWKDGAANIAEGERLPEPRRITRS